MDSDIGSDRFQGLPQRLAMAILNIERLIDEKLTVCPITEDDASKSFVLLSQRNDICHGQSYEELAEAAEAYFWGYVDCLKRMLDDDYKKRFVRSWG